MLRTAGLDRKFFVFVHPRGLDQVGLKFECASESLREFVKTLIADSTLRVSDSAGLGLA